MPSKIGKLTSSETAVVQAFAETNSVEFARLKGQYRSDQAVYQALKRPAIQAEIIKHQQQILIGELLPASTAVLAAALDMDTPGVPWSARTAAAKIVRSEVAGMADSKGAKDFSDMTADEIHQAIEDARRQLAERSKPVLDHVDDTSVEGAFE